MKALTYVIGILGFLLAAFLLTTAWAQRSFNNNVEREVKLLFKHQGELPQSRIRAEEIEGLPPAVQRWLTGSGIVGRERVRTVRLRQTGEMRTAPEQSWMPFTANYYYTVGEPGFIWHADVRAFPLVHLAGRDKLFQGHGNMLIKLFALITVADGKGREIDQGSLVRYLAEIAWFPSAALSPAISWKELDEDSALATMRVGDIEVNGTFFFDQEGRLVKFTAPRYMERNGTYSLENWRVLLRNHQKIEGVVLPTEVEVIWDLEQGEFVWFKGQLVDIDFNQPEFY